MTRCRFRHEVQMLLCLCLATLSVVTGIARSEPAGQSVGKFRDPLDTPALMRTAVDQRPLMAVASAGTRKIAVGSRGMIIASDDGGKSWTQSPSPVQSDLLAVNFPTPNDGWVVGHDGVVLHTADAGKTWEKQLDGRLAGENFKKYYIDRGDAGAAHLAQIQQNYKGGPALPFLDVWFEDTQRGFAVGSFGMIIATADGGKTWEPWLHRIDNPQSLNLNAVRGFGDDVYIAGEHGQIYRLDRSGGRFIATETGYIGSFFGIAANDDTLVAYGLRGTIYRSSASGGKRSRANGSSWEPLAIPSEQTLGAGLVRPDGSFVLVNAAGEFVLLDPSGRNPRIRKPTGKPMRLTGIVAEGDAYIVTGLDGMSRQNLAQ